MSSKTVLLIRLGAIGDCVIITPVIQKLYEQGYEIILNTGKRGMNVFKHDPRITRFIEHDEDIPIAEVSKHWETLKEEVKPDKFINFTESIECNVALHPTQPLYIYPKEERRAVCNRNYYDVTAKWAGLDNCDKRPSLYFTDEEEGKAKSYLKKGKFNILWALSGSGKNKVYPWTDYVMGEILKDNDVHIITVGDEKCQLLENILNQFPKDRMTELAGKIEIRESLCLTKHVDLVISPDTGVLHAAGCFTTPKIGLLGHTTMENITKYFESDYSIEAKCACAPCFRLIYDHDIQCPLDMISKSSWCMSQGLPPERLYEQYKKVRGEK